MGRFMGSAPERGRGERERLSEIKTLRTIDRHIADLSIESAESADRFVLERPARAGRFLTGAAQKKAFRLRKTGMKAFNELHRKQFGGLASSFSWTEKLTAEIRSEFFRDRDEHN